MAFIDSIDDEFKIKIKEESQTDLLEVWKYLDNDTVFKLKFWYEPPRLYRRVDCLSQAALSDSQRLS
jgi:phage-related protein